MSKTETLNKIKSITKKITGFALVSYIIASMVVIGVGCVVFADYSTTKTNVKNVVEREKNNAIVYGFTMSLIRITKSRISDYEKNHIAELIVRTSDRIFSDVDSRKAFAVLVAIESKFDKNAKSPVGATGLSQIIPRYAESFGKQCGIEGFHQDDITSPELNLLIGACQFNELMKVLGNTALALVAYNAGQNSESLKDLQNLRNIENKETANYVSKFTYLKGAAENEIQNNEEETVNEEK